MTIAIYYFRNDLRLEDNSAFMLACKNADFLIPIYIHEEKCEEETRWGFSRVGQHRKVFLQESLEDLRIRLRYLGSDLFELAGDFKEIFTSLRINFDVKQIYCEQIEAPEELEEVKVLKNIGFEVIYSWQSSMLDPQYLPFKLDQMPDVFTQFRQQVEKQKLKFADPIAAPSRTPPLPIGIKAISQVSYLETQFDKKSFLGGESRALLHIEQYFDRRLPDTYKQTRNQLIGIDYSSKFSPWLALGCCSARSIAKKLTEYELQNGANDGTYWLWFELLWRDYFRFLHFKYGNQLYRSKGLSTKSNNLFNDIKFNQWVSGTTGESFIDAGMRELKVTGYLSNRMRQIVASYWIYNMRGDWQAGAAWFESQLVDFDVYSNQGNWLYIAGKGTDPRGGRPMNLTKQTQDHDPDEMYRKIWLS
jgi:deoxyribodipyrimidine photo-lyase